MQTVAETEFASHALDYLKEVEQEGGLCIASGARTVAIILPVSASSEPRPFGLYRGQVSVHADFNAPLPDDLLKAFEGDNSN